MDENRIKVIVTEGDARVNTISTLGEMKHMSSCMLNSTQFLLSYMEMHLDNKSHKSKMSKQINLLIRSMKCLEEKINYVISQQGVQKLSGRAESRKRATCNLKLKRDTKLKLRRSTNYLSVEDNVLAGIVDERKPASNKTKVLDSRLQRRAISKKKSMM